MPGLFAVLDAAGLASRGLTGQEGARTVSAMNRFRRCVAMGGLVAVLVGAQLIAPSGAAPAEAYQLWGCYRATDMKPTTKPLDVYVAFVPGGKSDAGYYPRIGIDAANAWYAAVHNIILWKSPDGRSQVGVRAYAYGTLGKFAGITTKTRSTALQGYACPSTKPYTKFTDDTWANWNTTYTNSYSDRRNRQIMVHELGHAMGLADVRSGNSCNTAMWWQIVDCSSWVPRWDDVYGIQALYPGRA